MARLPTPPGRFRWSAPGIGAIAAMVFLAAQLAGLGDWPAALLAVLGGAAADRRLARGRARRYRRRAVRRQRPRAQARDHARQPARHLRGPRAGAERRAARGGAGADRRARSLPGLALVAAHAGSRALLAAGDVGDAAGARRRARRRSRPATPPRCGRRGGADRARDRARRRWGRCTDSSRSAAAAAGRGAAAALARRRIGGYTGDILGAFQQIGEIVMLLAAVGGR